MYQQHTLGLKRKNESELFNGFYRKVWQMEDFGTLYEYSDGTSQYITLSFFSINEKAFIKHTFIKWFDHIVSTNLIDAIWGFNHKAFLHIKE